MKSLWSDISFVSEFNCSSWSEEMNLAEGAVKQMSFGLPIYLNATRSGEGTAIFRRPKSFLRAKKY